VSFSEVFATAFEGLGAALYSIGLSMLSLQLKKDACETSYLTSSLPSHTRFLLGDDNSSTSDGDLLSTVCVFSNIVYGANFATSSIAIYNLFSFEQKMGPSLRTFGPTWKFWSMKIPVTLSFTGVILLRLIQPFTGLNLNQIDFLEAIIKAYCMLLVAALNLKAWYPTEEWYTMDAVHPEPCLRMFGRPSGGGVRLSQFEDGNEPIIPDVPASEHFKN